MRFSQMSGTDLLKRFETACFHITNYPNNKSYTDEFRRLEKEIAKRLGAKVEELNN